MTVLLTSGLISPSSFSLNSLPIADDQHDASYYLSLWAKNLSKSNYRIKYNLCQQRAKVVLEGEEKSIFIIPCHNIDLIKAYYITYRLLDNDVNKLKEFLETDRNSIQSNASIDSETSLVHTNQSCVNNDDNFAGLLSMVMRDADCCAIS
jgi:hypothetical protein